MQLGAIFLDLPQDGRGRRHQLQPPDPAVPRIGPALDEAARLQPIDQAADGDRLDLDDRRQLVLGKSRLALEVRQDHPLGSRHPPGAGALVRPRAHLPGNVVEQHQELGVEADLHGEGTLSSDKIS